MRRLIEFWREYGRRYRWVYAAGLLCLLLTNVLTVAIPGFIEAAVDALTKTRDPDSAMPMAIAIIGAGLGIIVVRTLSRTLFFNPGRTIEFRLKNGLFKHLTELPASFFQAMSPGEIISRGTNDANSVRALIGYGSLAMFNVSFTLVITVGTMALEDLSLTLLCVGPLVVAAGVLRVAIRAMFRVTASAQQQIAVLSDRILESYNGAAVITGFNATEGVQQRFDDANQRLLSLGLRLIRITSWLLPVVSVVGNLCVVVLLYVGGSRVIEGSLSLGQLVAFTVYINILVNGLISLGWMVNAVQRGYISLGRVNEVLDTSVARPPVRGEMPAPACRAGYGLKVSGLSFSYPSSEAKGAEATPGPVLDDVSFEVAPGETVGIFGYTGSGKTTLLQLIARVVEPPPGTVSIAETDIGDFAVADYWRALAYVPQDAFLFSQSVRDNIALSADTAEVDDARVWSAADDAALLDDLDALPDGLDTVVGERGVTLSGGQRQRTALARAFYRDFKILLLDDVMSAVDHATEQRLIDAVYRRAQGVTTLIVSHRVSALARADRVLVLHEGRLVGQGSHEALVAAGRGPYWRAWRLQQSDAAMSAAHDEGGVDAPH